MIKKTITYPGFDGKVYTEDFYFNLTQGEAVRMELSAEGNSLSDQLKTIAESKNGKLIIETFESIILGAYGTRSADGKQFIKNADAAAAFSYTEAYSQLLVEMTTDLDASTTFVNGLLSGNPIAPKAGLTSAEARARSEAALQGHLPKKVAQAPIEVVETAADTSTENEAADFREFQRQRAATATANATRMVATPEEQQLPPYDQ